MARASLTIEKRDASGKSPTARRMRNTNRVPGVMYHPDGNVSFSADELELAAVIRKGNTLIDVEGEGVDKQLTVLKEYQVHPVRGNLQHLDLQAVKMDQTVRTSASLVLVGESPGIKEGAILTQGTQSILIECKASEIPDRIEFDISEVHAGETVILRDVPMPEGITAMDDEGTMVVALTVPRGAKGKKRQNADGTDMTDAENEAADVAEFGAEAAEGDAPAGDA